jgi:hypothetical protein
MTSLVNQERVNDTAKLMMHRLIARELRRDPSLVERARDFLNRSAEHYSFVHEWNQILERPVSEIRSLLTNRDETMTRLRLSSPFVVAGGIDFGDEALRHRIWKAAKRTMQRATRGDARVSVGL